MQWNNNDSTSNPATQGVAAARTQTMKLIDDSGNVIAVFTRSATGTISFTVNDESFLSAVAASISIAASTILVPNIPTADPVVAGALWSDTGTVKVSAGA